MVNGMRASVKEELSCEMVVPLDRQAIMARLQDDEELLREIVQLFLEDTPQLVKEARAALAAGDAARLQRAAHTIKGSVGNFEAAPAVDAAWVLESLSQTGALGEAPAALYRLEQILDSVRISLQALIAQPAAI